MVRIPLTRLLKGTFPGSHQVRGEKGRAKYIDWVPEVGEVGLEPRRGPRGAEGEAQGWVSKVSPGRGQEGGLHGSLRENWNHQNEGWDHTTAGGWWVRRSGPSAARISARQQLNGYEGSREAG